MKHHIINKGKNINANLFTFFDCIDKNKESLIENILREVYYIDNVGYAGYRDKEALKKFLIWAIPKNKNNEDIKILKEKEIINNVKKTLNKLLLFLKDKNKLNIFVFPTFYNSIINKLNGVDGYCIWKNTIVLLIYPIKGWENSLKNVMTHETAHALSPYYHKINSIGNWLVLDGIAENFREDHLKNGASKIVKSISKKEAIEIFKNIKKDLDKVDEDLHRNLFYGNSKYKPWSGYAIGYYLVKDYLKKQNKIDWNKIIKISPKVILKDIDS